MNLLRVIVASVQSIIAFGAWDNYLLSLSLEQRYPPQLLASVHYHRLSIWFPVWTTCGSIALWWAVVWLAFRHERAEGW